MPPRLARQAVTAAALRGDAAALLAACAYLPPREAFRYDRRRAAAFSSALAGERLVALGELGLGGGVRSVRLGLDIAVIELLTRGAAPALEAVRLALRDGVHGEPDVPLVLAACVRRDPEVTRNALGVALSGGTLPERTHAAAAVIGAARPGPVQAAVPAVVAVSLAVAALAFMRLPGVTDTQEAATPRLQVPRPSVVVAAPPRKVVGGGSASPGDKSLQAATQDASSIAARFTPGGSGSGSADGTGSLNGRAGSPATPRPAPGSPEVPGPSAAEPPSSEPTPPVSPPTTVTSEGATAAPPASSPPPAAASPAEPSRQPALAKPSKAERKAEKAERKADKTEARAAKKAEKAAARSAPSVPLTTVPTSQPEAEAAFALASGSAPETDDERRSKPDKPDKPDKPEKPEKNK